MSEKKPYLAMVLVQVIFAGMSMVAKAAFNDGMSTYVFVFYRQAISAVLFIPIALIFGRKSAPPLQFKLMMKIFVLALFGYTINVNLHSMAINYTSATVASAANNLTPVFAFIMAVLLRMESVKVKSASGMMKIGGIVLCLVGVMLIAFYKGPSIRSFTGHHHPILHGSAKNRHSDGSIDRTWIIGTFLMVLVGLCWASWMVLQGILLREYPSMLWSATLTCVFSTFQSFLVAIVFERRMSKWKLQPGDGLIAVVYNGLLVAALVLYLQTWCIGKKGPVFVAMFTPLSLVITIATSSFILGELISLGSVLGGVFLVGGLYSVLLGKSSEERAEKAKIKEGVQLQGAGNDPNICNDELNV